MQSFYPGVVFCGVLLLAGCSTPVREPVPIERDPSYTDTSEPVTPVSSPVPAQPPVSGAAQSLMKKAEVASSRGDYEQALVLLERAQRIEPDRGEIYLALAETYKAKGDFSMASAAAERGMLYCSDSSQCGALRAFVH